MRAVILLVIIFFSVTFAQQDKSNVADFNDVDANKDNTISIDEFESFYRNQIDSNIAKARSLFHSHDVDRNSKLVVSEFVPLAFSLSRQQIKGENEFFNRLDQNKDGALTRSEIYRSDENLNEEIINGLFFVADIDHNGRITSHEYELAMVSDNKKDNKQSGLISSIDQNHDHLISKAEITDFVTRLSQNNK